MALSAEFGGVNALGMHEVTEGHEADSADSEEHDELREAMDAMLVVIDLVLVLLDILKELDGVLGCVEVLLVDDLLHLLLLREGLIAVVTVRLHNLIL